MLVHVKLCGISDKIMYSTIRETGQISFQIQYCPENSFKTKSPNIKITNISDYNLHKM